MRALTIAFILSLSAGALAFSTAYRAPGFCPPETDPPAAAPLEVASAKAPRSPQLLKELLAKYDAHPDRALLPAINAAAGQHDAIWSRLYWHTDLASAQAQAKAEHKPILYLRMLGKLTDEYSCANSRFFRTALYANESVSKLLRDKFVLVWESERPVPVVFIDFGDGRVLKRTITGNSAHYVLDADGHVVDAIPGLFDPSTFASVVSAAGEAAAAGSGAARSSYIATAEQSLAAQWTRETAGRSALADEAVDADLSAFDPAPLAADAGRPAVGKYRVEARLAAEATPPRATPRAPARVPGAAEAGELALGKSIVELPILRAASPSSATVLREAVASAGDGTWVALAARHAARPETRLDDNSIALMRSQRPVAFSNAAAFARTVEQFQLAMAEDTVRNNYKLRRQVLGWLKEANRPVPVADLNTRVYAELFLTPRTDPWLGLVPQDAYTGLCEDDCMTP